MRDLEGQVTSGSFHIGDVWVPGELTCRGSSSSLYLHSDSYFSIGPKCRSIHGVLADRTRVTLAGCLPPPGTGSGTNGGQHYSFAKVFPHYILSGGYPADPDQPSITVVHVETDDAEHVFYDFDAFGIILGDVDISLAQLLEQQSREIGRNIPIGEDPILQYFTGKTNIACVETPIGRISIDHRLSHNFGGVRGVRVDSRIVASIEFLKPQTLEQTIDSLLVYLRFMAVAAGREQNIVRVYVETAAPSGMTVEEAAHRRPLLLHWSLKPERREKVSDEVPHPGDLPLDPIENPKRFGEILCDWITRDVDWSMARVRFHNAWCKGRNYNIDRLVTAANMFDILPEAAASKKTAISEPLEKVRREIRALLKPLPDSLEKQSLLGAVGRLGNASLKHKVRHRVSLLPQTIKADFPDLDLVTDQAINCRNFFVHGGESKLDYHDTGLIAFFTRALEFVFAASDLAEAGWEPDWSQRPPQFSHPFGVFRIVYGEMLEELRSLLALGSSMNGNPAADAL